MLSLVPVLVVVSVQYTRPNHKTWLVRIPHLVLFHPDCYLICFFKTCTGPVCALDFTFANCQFSGKVCGNWVRIPFWWMMRFPINLGLKLSEYGNTKSQCGASSNRSLYTWSCCSLWPTFWDVVSPCSHVPVSLMSCTYYNHLWSKCLHDVALMLGAL